MKLHPQDARRLLLPRSPSSRLVSWLVFAAIAYCAWASHSVTRWVVVAVLIGDVYVYLKTPSLYRNLYRRYMVGVLFQERAMGLETSRIQADPYLDLNPATDTVSFYQGVSFALARLRKELERAETEVDTL